MPGLDDRWADRDYPILEWIVDQLANQRDEAEVNNETLADAFDDLDERDRLAAVANLQRGGYITNVSHAFGNMFDVGDITERALRETGIWPNEQAMADQLLWYVEQRVNAAVSADERTRWTRIRDALAGAGRDFTVELAAAMATRSLGG